MPHKASKWILKEITGIITTTQKLIEEESIMPNHGGN
jgi:hypothetical protein